jgi:hypothetical protein
MKAAIVIARIHIDSQGRNLIVNLLWLFSGCCMAWDLQAAMGLAK